MKWGEERSAGAKGLWQEALSRHTHACALTRCHGSPTTLSVGRLLGPEPTCQEEKDPEEQPAPPPSHGAFHYPQGLGRQPSQLTCLGLTHHEQQG